MANFKQEPPSSNLLEFARTANAGVPKRRSAPPSARPAPPSVAPSAAAPALAPEVAPVMLSVPPAPSRAAQLTQPRVDLEPAPPASRGAVFFLVLAGFSGLLLSLYRNDVFHDLTHASRFEAAYDRVEGALGAPGFGTPRSLEALVHLPAAALPGLAAVPSPAGALPVAKPAAEEASPSAAAAAAPEAASPAPSPEPGEPKPVLSAPKAHALSAPQRAQAAKHAQAPAPAKHAAADAPPAVSLSEDSAPAAPAKKKPEATKEATPAPNLDDAIRAAMQKH